jgi:NitT/TauT family transport system substrate-binding protein
MGSVASVAAKVGAKIKLVPMSSGVAGLAEMRAGALDFAAGVGGPPTVAAIANGTPIDVLWVQDTGSDALLVSKSIVSSPDLVGRTVGVLEGSAPEYELRGWLAAEGLTTKVRVVGFASEAAAAAAYLGRHIAGAYVSGALAVELTSKGAHALTDFAAIAKLGYSSLYVLAVNRADVVRYPQTVQKYVCAELAATNDLLGPNNRTYFADSAKLLGAPVSQAVAGSLNALPSYVRPDQELHWLDGGPASPIVSSYLKVASFDHAQGTIPKVPSAETLATHIDPSFARAALSGKC